MKTLADGQPARTTLIRTISSACGLMLAIALLMPAARAADLPGGVQQRVGQTVGAWMSSGDSAAAGAAIADMCSENPGIALDIVAHAGEVAAKASTPEKCLATDSNCPVLEDLLAVLYQQAIRTNSGGRRSSPAAPLPGPGGSGGPVANKPGSNGPPLPCQATGTCGGEEPPVSTTRL